MTLPGHLRREQRREHRVGERGGDGAEAVRRPGSRPARSCTPAASSANITTDSTSPILKVSAIGAALPMRAEEHRAHGVRGRGQQQVVGRPRSGSRRRRRRARARATVPAARGSPRGTPPAASAMRQNGSERKMVPKPAICVRSVAPCPGRGFSGTTKNTSSAATTDKRAQHVEQAAPAERLDQRLRGRGRRQPADAAGGEIQPVQRGEAREREPQRERLDRAHQPGRHAEADQRAADRQHGEVAREREDQRAGRRDAQQRRHHAARAVAVEQHAERQLERGERKQVHRSEEAEIRRRERELARQLLGDHRVDVAKEERQEVAGREWAEHHKHGLRR